MGRIRKAYKDVSDLAVHIAGNCLGMRVRRIDRAITRIYNDAVRRHGMRATQLNVLSLIALLGPVGPDRLCGLLDMSASSLSRTLDRMKLQGWLAVSPVRDGRRRALTLSPAGEKALREARAGWEAAQKNVSAILGEDGVSAVHALADRLEAGEYT
jgi:DNA-binding MarR family transcriptional regulator